MMTSHAHYKHLSFAERGALNAVVETIASLDGLKCALWGGSTRFLSEKRPWSDVDVWVVLDRVDEHPNALACHFRQIDDVRLVHEIGHLPWFGHLFSLFFFQDCTFAVDVGLCTMADVSNLNPGPNPMFILGSNEAILEVRAALTLQTYIRSQHVRAETLLAHLLKMRKSLARNHLWNAMECLSRSRRELLGLLLDGRGDRVIYYGRADRDAEDHLDVNELEVFAMTAPHYNEREIRHAAAIIANYAADSGRCPAEIENELRRLTSALRSKEKLSIRPTQEL